MPRNDEYLHGFRFTFNRQTLFMNLNKKFWQWALLIALAFTWGASFILIKKGLESYTYSQVGALRIFIAFIFLIPFIIKNLKKITRKNIKSLIIVAFIGNGIPAFLFAKAQTQVSSSLAGMLNTLVPLFTLIIGFLLYKSSAKLVNIIGIFIGLIGAIGILFKPATSFFAQNNWYVLFIVVATAFYGLNVNEIKYKLKELDGTAIAALAFLLIGPFAGIYLIFSDYSYALSTENYMINLGYIVLLALFSSVIAVIAFNILIKYVTTIFAASVTYFIPVFAIFWGIFDGETVTLYQIFWISIILLGVYFVNKE